MIGITKEKSDHPLRVTGIDLVKGIAVCEMGIGWQLNRFKIPLREFTWLMRDREGFDEK